MNAFRPFARKSPLHAMWHRRVEGQIRDCINSHSYWFNFKNAWERGACVNSLAKRIVGEIVEGASHPSPPAATGVPGGLLGGPETAGGASCGGSEGAGVALHCAGPAGDVVFSAPQPAIPQRLLTRDSAKQIRDWGRREATAENIAALERFKTNLGKAASPEQHEVLDGCIALLKVGYDDPEAG